MNKIKPSKRVFVGIKMTEEVAEACLKLQADLADLPAVFKRPEDIHLTLMPPWEMTNQKEVENLLQKALRSLRPFVLKLDGLSYGPNGMRPKVVWVKCAATSEIIAIKKELLKVFDVRDHFPFVPHVTIARLLEKDMETLAHRPVERPIVMSMPVESVELFESANEEGKGYTVLTSISIPKNDNPR